MCSMNWWASEGINQEIQACLPGHLREETMNIATSTVPYGTCIPGDIRDM